eukprot:CAMPEP_0172476706 /NCGR_PEP_ID=MMETSP1065-20121228/70515_1 /TAXON_ID=265537 /ORGANISM="Amphiprora paludosa, Strain CCMP125" /LENGTH=663 /DNA_ID=CAMNT_0013234935 /DNA_START=140 /DNA_END=2131 /DNA_ORIENTATION=+
MATSRETTAPVATNGGPVWDPVAQIYVGGQVPENGAQVKELIEKNNGTLRVFGYGSLCWKPGGILANPKVTSTLGKALGYRRCWAQKSTDHRGEPRFPGIVCTLLKDDEVKDIRGTTTSQSEQSTQSLTEGVLYVVPPELVEDCLAELDFREKGGYARDVIEVVEDESGDNVQALLYRGTPDNPAIWTRALRDLPYAAAVLSAATGPSGKNDVYLNNLNQFLEKTTNTTATKQFDDTINLCAMARLYQSISNLFFIYGAGSNQHNQLLLESANNAAGLVNGNEDAHELKEMLICVPKEIGSSSTDPPKDIIAGGGHSGLLTVDGKLYLFGWNERGQSGPSTSCTLEAPVPMVSPLDGLLVDKCAMGHNHTLLIEKDTGHLYAFGDNSRGQVDGVGSQDSVEVPTKPAFWSNDCAVDISCGLFHSAAITSSGKVLVFGCGRFGQALSESISKSVWVGKWKPENPESNLKKVGCGRRHTVVLDEEGRIFSWGDNKYGQLGRVFDSSNKRDSVPKQVHGPWEEEGFIVRDIQCGWSHTVVRATKKVEGGLVETSVFGWGRNDKGQLGLGDEAPDYLELPCKMFQNHSSSIQQIECGSEFTVIVDSDDSVWGCGWNEHGNLAQNHNSDSSILVKFAGAAVGNPPGNPETAKLSIAAGGAHIMVMRVP